MKEVIVLILLASMVSAEIVYDEWLDNGDNFNVGDIRMNVIWTGDSAFVKFNNKGYDLIEGECEGEGIIDVCLTDLRMKKGGEEVPRTINDPYAEVEMLIEVNASIAKIDIEHTIETNTLETNEKSRIDIIISNVGLTDAVATFEDDYPDEILVRPITGCVSNNNKITWDGTIKKNERHRLSYELTGLEEKKFTSKATVEYFNGIETEKETKSTRISVKAPALNIDIDSKTRLTTGDETDVVINITKNYDALLDVDMIKLVSTEGLIILEPYELDNYDWDEKEEEFIEIFTTIKAHRTGEQWLSVLAEYETEIVQQNLNESIKFRILEDIELEIDFDLPDFRVDTVSAAKIELFNPGEDAHDMKVIVTSELPGLSLEKEVELLGTRNTISVFDGNITPVSEGSYPLSITVSYENTLGEMFENTITKTIQVDGVKIKKVDEQDESAVVSPQTIAKQSKGGFKYTGLAIIIAVIVAGMLLFYIRYKIRE